MIEKQFNDLSKEIETTVSSVVRGTDAVLQPYRKSVFRRFPILFTLLVTFGIAAVFYGFERVIADSIWLGSRPWLILGIGLLILALTGTLFKKLDRYEDT